MRVAFTSTDGKAIDEHFGQATHFHVWEVGADRAEFVGIVGAFGGHADEDDRIQARADAIEGCALVYTIQVGGPAAAKLVARRIHPMKTGVELPVEAALAKLQEVLRGRPPPWLRKAMGGAPDTAAAAGGEDDG